MRRLLLIASMLLFPAFAPPSVAHAKGNEIEGYYRMVSAELAGNPFPEKVRRTISLEIRHGEYLVLVGEAPDRGTIRIDSAARPGTMDVTGTEGPNQGRTFHAIYERRGRTLRICYDLSGAGRPAEFTSHPGTKEFLVTYEKVKKPKAAKSRHADGQEQGREGEPH